MKKRILIYSLTIGLYAMLSAFRMHELKLSTSEITCSEQKLQIRIKLFADDLGVSLATLAKKTVPFEGSAVDPQTLSLLNQYVLSNFRISINGTPVTLRMKNAVVQEDQAAQIKTVWVNVESGTLDPATVKRITLTNTLLFESIPEQKNITTIRLFNDNSKTALFENMNGDRTKEVLY